MGGARGGQWHSVSLLEVFLFCDAPPIPIATGNSAEGIVYEDDMGPSSSPKSKTLVTRIEACFERLWIPRFRSLKLTGLLNDRTHRLALRLAATSRRVSFLPPDGNQEP